MIVAILLRLLINALAVLALTRLLPEDIQVNGLGNAFLMSVVLGLLNSIVRPVLRLLTCPINLVTFGLVGLLINVLLFWLAIRLAQGQVTPLGAIIGVVFLWLVSVLTNHLIRWRS